MTKVLRGFFQALLPLLLLIAGIMVVRQLILSRPKPKKKDAGELVTPVTGTVAAQTSVSVIVEAAGTVLPTREVEMRPQVSGQIVEISDALQPGGYFAEGDLLLRIDPRDYEMMVQQRQADVARANFELKTERGRQAVAKREWELMGADLPTTEEGKALTLRIPHLEQAEANLAAAESSLAQARLNLERATIRAPFNALITMEQVDLGQLVTPQTPIATLTGTDRYWIQASVPVDRIDMIAMPDAEGEGGALAHIHYNTGRSTVEKQGRVIRLLGDLEESGRMARVLISVDDPLGLKGDGEEIPLLMHAFVSVSIEGARLENVVPLPAKAVREGNRIWVMNDEDRLEIRNIDLAWQEKNRVLLRTGVAAGERVVTSRIGTPIPGMKLKLTETPTAAGALDQEGHTDE